MTDAQAMRMSRYYQLRVVARMALSDNADAVRFFARLGVMVMDAQGKRRTIDDIAREAIEIWEEV